MGKIRLEFVVSLVVAALCFFGSATLLRSAMAFNARESVDGTVVAIGEGRDGNGVPFSTATVAWQSVGGGTHQLSVTDPDRFAFTIGQTIELKRDPEDPTNARVAGAANRVYIGVVAAGIGLYFVFAAIRGGARSRPGRKPT